MVPQIVVSPEALNVESEICENFDLNRHKKTENGNWKSIAEGHPGKATMHHQ